jgi:regulator of RNase E activity RraA
MTSQDSSPPLGGGLVDLPVTGPAFERVPAELIEALAPVSSATATATLHKLGVQRTFAQGAIARTPGRKVIGTALTLQFMPQREDLVSGLAQEEVEKRSALWSVLEQVQQDDVLVVQAYGDLYSGCLGEMLVTYFRERGGTGIVIDGCIRDWPRIQQLEMPVWARGTTPNYASQTSLFPWGHSVPIACAGVLVLPGDIVIADDDGAVVVPRRYAPNLIETALDREGYEAFSRARIAEGGKLSTYYPLSREGRQEYERYRASR